MNLANDRMEAAGLAHRRYPDMPLDLALFCFRSDRRTAGLGALDERKRKRRGEVANYKLDVFEHRQVRYHLIRHTRARREYDPESFSSIDVFDAKSTVLLIDIPERTQHLVVPVDYFDFENQRGRRRVAIALRIARRQLREAQT
jgi:hypothetical protein